MSLRVNADQRQEVSMTITNANHENRSTGREKRGGKKRGGKKRGRKR